jgi:hypothetical protein
MAIKHNPDGTRTATFTLSKTAERAKRERDMSTWMSVDTPDHKFTIQYDEGRLKIYCNTAAERVELIDQYGAHFYG